MTLPIEHIHTYLVHPRKGAAELPEIGGSAIPLDGKLFGLLGDIYERSARDCDIEISFNHAPTGTQTNACRDLIVEYLSAASVARGRAIAERLGNVTDARSRIGLLFLIAGKEGRSHKVVISRFPTDSAILAEENRKELSVEFLERVFMKSATSYKAAAYEDTSLKAGFWLGRATDKQVNGRDVHLSNYWISEFLDSDFRTTSAAGTKRLAAALRGAIRRVDDVSIKTEIAAAVTLSKSLTGRKVSINEFMEHFGFSDESKAAVAGQVASPHLMRERFQFNTEEFSKQVAFRSVELDTGGILTAETAEFDNVFEREMIDEKTQEVRFSTQGKITSEKLGKVRQ